MAIFNLLLVFSVARAMGPSVTASDGTTAPGAAEPAWLVVATPVPSLPDAGALVDDLERAWGLRRDLANEKAAELVASVVSDLRPTLDSRQRDLLQRALFLKGLLRVDAAGSLEGVPNAVPVGALRIPAEWAEGIATSPGAPAPAANDASYATHAYDEARTLLAAWEGTTIDASAPGADVRIDGEPVTGELRVLPGLHTLSFHPPGAVPYAVLFRVGAGGGELPISDLNVIIAQLAAFVKDGSPPPRTVRDALFRRLGAPAALVRTGDGARTLWLVDGIARWGKTKVSAGVSVGTSLLAGAWSATPAGCGGVDEGDKALVPLSAVGVATLGPWRARGGGGVIFSATDAGFATTAPVECAGAQVAGATGPLGFGWAGIGRRIPLGGRSEFELGLRAGGSSAFAFAGLSAVFPVVARKQFALEVEAYAGAFANAWSGEGDRSGFLGGLGTTVLMGSR